MIQIIFLIFFKINSFYVTDSYFSSSFGGKIIVICNNNVPPILDSALTVPTDIIEHFGEGSLDIEGSFPLWVIYIIESFENWSLASGGGISFIYSVDNNSFCDCSIDTSYNNICWSGQDLIGSDLTKLDVNGNTKNIIINSIYEPILEGGDKFCDGEGATCYDFLSVMNHAVGMFLGFEEHGSSATTESVMSSVDRDSIDFRDLKEDDINGVKCVYPAIGDAFTSDPECCFNANPFLRPSTCSNFGFTSNGPFIGAEPGAGGGCAYIADKNSNKQNFFYLIYILSFSSIFIFRFFFKKYLILFFLFYSFNIYSAFEDDLGLDDYDYKALEQNIENPNVEKKEYMSTKEIIDKEKENKVTQKKMEEKIEAEKVEGLVKNLDTQIKFKRFREKNPYFTNISFGITYSTVSDFKKINNTFKDAGILGLKGFPYTYNFLFEFGLENIFTQGLIFYFSTGYEFNTTDSGTGNLDYEGNIVSTSFNNTFYSIPLKLGTRYNFVSNDSLRVGAGFSGGLWVASGTIIVLSPSSVPNTKVNSKLELSGLGYTANVGTNLDWVLTKKLFFTLNLSYEYSKCSNVSIDSSSGWFESNYPSDSRLLVIEDGITRPFNFLIAGPNLSIGFKGVF